jgi:hypothetical protein
LHWVQNAKWWLPGAENTFFLFSRNDYSSEPGLPDFYLHNKPENIPNCHLSTKWTYNIPNGRNKFHIALCRICQLFYSQALPNLSKFTQICIWIWQPCSKRLFIGSAWPEARTGKTHSGQENAQWAFLRWKSKLEAQQARDARFAHQKYKFGLYFWGTCNGKVWVYFMAVSIILRPFGMFCGNVAYLVVIWYYMYHSRFGTYIKTSGNPGTNSEPVSPKMSSVTMRSILKSFRTRKRLFQLFEDWRPLCSDPVNSIEANAPAALLLVRLLIDRRWWRKTSCFFAFFRPFSSALCTLLD